MFSVTIPSLTINIYLTQEGPLLMATLNEVLDRLSTISTSLTNIREDIQVLKDQVAAGAPVTQAQLDDLFARVNTLAGDAETLASEQ